MKRLFSLILAFALALPDAFPQDRVSAIRSRLLAPDDGSVLVAAHRGCWKSVPENSVPAIEAAVAAGADIVEIDVRKTLDGQLVLMHDASVGRTTDGSGKVASMTLEQIRKLHLLQDGKPSDERVPTLEEALLAAKGKVMLNLDKAFGYFDEVYALARRTGTLDHIIIKGSCPASVALERMGERRDSVIFMPIVNLRKSYSRIYEYLAVFPVPMFEFIWPGGDSGYARAAKVLLGGRSRIWYNTMWAKLCGGKDDSRALKDPDANWGYLIDFLGAGALQTDESASMAGYLRSRR